MKKLLLLIVILISIGIQARKYVVQTTEFKYYDGIDWHQAQHSSASILFNLDTNTIIIYSEQAQVFNIVSYTCVEDLITARLYTFNCIDDLHKSCKISTWYFDKHGSMFICYDNYKYSYLFKKVE